MKKCVFAALAAFAACSAASAQVRFNEAMVNPPGTDNLYEWLELMSDTPNFDMTGLTIVVIEGDDSGDGTGVAGVIDQALSLSGRSTGANNLFLWKSSAVGTPPFTPADPATVVFAQDFVPDLENGANTFLIVEGFTGSVGQDLDTGPNDGVLDVQPWTRVVDAIGFTSGDVATGRGYTYAAQLGGQDVSDARGLLDGFTPDTFFRLCGCSFSSDVLGSQPGEYFVDPIETASVGTDCVDLNAIFYETTEGRANFYSEQCPSVGGCTWEVTGGCASDQDADGDVDSDDINLFFGEFENGGSCGDHDEDGDTDSDDISLFFAAFENGSC